MNNEDLDEDVNFLDAINEVEEKAESDDENVTIEYAPRAITEVDFEEEEARELLAGDPASGGFSWLKQKGESSRTYIYFQIWLELRYMSVPLPRLIKNVQDVYHKRTGESIGDQSIQKHMKKHNWVQRTLDFDKFQLASKAEAIKYRAPIEAERLINTSHKLMEVANNALAHKLQVSIEDPESISINEIAKMMRIAIDANRSSQEVMQLVRKEVKDTENDKNLLIDLVEKYGLNKDK